METVDNVARLGGALCLDFANTVEPRSSESPEDLLRERDDVIRFGIRSGLDVRPARRRPGGRLSAASDAEQLARARALREAVYAVFAAIATGRKPEPPGLAALHSAYSAAIERSDLAPGTYEWRSTADDVDAVLDAVARDAVELLQSPRRARVKQCRHDAVGCGWLFLDATKSGTRRWCSMRVCGTRAKVSRQRSRPRG